MNVSAGSSRGGVKPGEIEATINFNFPMTINFFDKAVDVKDKIHAAYGILMDGKKLAFKKHIYGEEEDVCTSKNVKDGTTLHLFSGVLPSSVADVMNVCTEIRASFRCPQVL
ncbi:hypothetical protein OROGR_027739 [Orobanche gracilis]